MWNRGPLHAGCCDGGVHGGFSGPDEADRFAAAAEEKPGRVGWPVTPAALFRGVGLFSFSTPRKDATSPDASFPAASGCRG